MSNSFKDFLILQESFDTKPRPWKLVEEDDDWSIYEFKTSGGESYVVIFSQAFPFPRYEVEFRLKYRIADYSLSNTGNQFEVLITVIDCINDFIARVDPEELKFSAAKPTLTHNDSRSRGKVYERLVKRFLKTKSLKLSINETTKEFQFRLYK